VDQNNVNLVIFASDAYRNGKEKAKTTADISHALSRKISSKKFKTKRYCYILEKNRANH
jgi:hypothetical protein